MKCSNLVRVTLVMLGLMVSGTALADNFRGHGGHGGRSHGSFGISIGIPIGQPYYYPSPYYAYPPQYYSYPYPYPYPYYPPVMVAPQSPPVYIERESEPQPIPQASAPQENYWYHCNKPEGYYPYIKECPGGWQKVVPEPPKP